MDSRNKAIDIVKLGCALLVLFLHTINMYRLQLNGFIGYFDDFVYRIIWFINPVEFFFVFSAYFLFSKELNYKNLAKVIKRLSILYCFWSLLYINNIISIINESTTLVYSIIKIIRLLFIMGTGGHMWYMLSLIYSLIFLYPILKRKKEKTAFILSFLFYLINLLGDSYYNVLPTGMGLYQPFKFFIGVMGGNLYLLRGPLFIMIGYMLAHKKIVLNLGPSFILFIIFGILNNIELDLLKFYSMGMQYSITIFKPFVVYIFCFIITNTNINLNINTIFFSKCSTCIYFAHIFFREILYKYINNIHLNFFVILTLCVILTLILDQLSNFKMFKFLKYVL